MTKPAQHEGWSSRISTRAAASGTLALAILLLSAVVATPPAQAQGQTTYRRIYAFKGGTDGSSPVAGLVRDAAGNLYGTTVNGGASGSGTVFKLDTTGKETVLYSFAGTPDGANSYAGLVRDTAGNLYGTTQYGGASGSGTVFKLDTTGKETVLYSFAGTPDGANPVAGLVRDTAGNLYGTTQYGGASGSGTVFKLDTTGKETVLYSFAGTPDGANPMAGLVRGAAGNFYGTTYYGGTSGNGTVFKLDANGKETLLHSFTGYPTDGSNPAAGLVRDMAGSLYGTTAYGGASTLGTVFKLDTTGKETVLYSFSGVLARPFAGLVRDAAGNLYGTTAYNGTDCNCGGVFELDTTGNETDLHYFGLLSSDGAYPFAGLVRDAAGNLYGTTAGGGISGSGTVFKLHP